MLIIGLIWTFWSKPKKKDKSQHSKQKEKYHRKGIKKELSTVKAQPWNLIVPLFLLLGLTLFLLWQDGMEKGAESIFDAFAEADATFIILLAVFITLIFTFIFYMIRKQKLDETLYHFYDGGNQLMEPIILLILVWALSLVAEDLGFSKFIGATLGSFLPAFTIPAIVFLVGSVVSYFIGSSFGTWGIFMPLGVALAASTGASLPMTVGAVFASGTFGAMTSPLGDTTITTASIMNVPLIDYARYKLKIVSIGVGIAAILYLAFGYFIGA
ncbi:Na+/H+ antiporter NhaC family protein [Piscibacillus salipiscarius]